MEFLRRQPPLQLFTPRRVELNQHLPFLHVQQHTPRRYGSCSVHPANQSSGALARQARERMLREVTWHLDSYEPLHEDGIKTLARESQAHDRDFYSDCSGCAWIFMAIRIGVVMNVVASAMSTIIVKSVGERMPRSRPAFSITSSTSPRVFIRTPKPSESLHVIPVALAVSAAPASLPTTAMAVMAAV